MTVIQTLRQTLRQTHLRHRTAARALSATAMPPVNDADLGRLMTSPFTRMTRSSRRTTRHSLARAGAVALASTLVLAACGSAPAAKDAALANPATPTDRVLGADHQAYRQQQAAIRALNDSGAHPLRSYSQAKAQCWLDVSFHEYTRNDRSAFPLQALQQSAAITDYLGAGRDPASPANPAAQTPLVNDALKLRDDLWTAAAGLKSRPGWRCVERQVACAEVELVHAGNEERQFDWRHARPYVQLAEDLIGEARLAEAACPQPEIVITPSAGPVPVEPPPPAPPAPLPPPVKETIVLSANVLFGFDRRSEGDLLPAGRTQLDQVVDKLTAAYERIDAIELVGYTDRLGKADYNARLSQDRADVVKTYLVRKGVTANVEAIGKGAADPVVQCPGKRITAQLTDCLQPNRRVEITITGRKR